MITKISYLNLILQITLKIHLQILYSQFSKGQQDAIEYIRTLLDDIWYETNRNKIEAKYEELNLDDKSKEEQSLKYKDFFWREKILY